MDLKSPEQNGNGYTVATSLEEAIILTKHGKFHFLLLFVCGICLIAMVAEVFGTAFLIPAAECEFSMGPSEKGVLNAITYIGMITSSHLWGYLADTRGRRKVLILALLVDGICSIFSSFAHAYWLFLLLRFLNGFFVCAPSAVVFAYLGEFHSLASRARAIMFLSVFLSFGGLYQQGFAWLLIPQTWMLEIPWIGIYYTPWRLFIITGCLPSFIAAIMLVFLLPESPKYLFSAGREQEGLQVLRYVFSMNTGQQAEEYPVTRVMLDETEPEAALKKKPMSAVQVVKSMWDQTKPLFERRYVLLTSLAFIIQFILYFSFNGFGMWLPDLYNRYAKYSELYPNHSLTICEVIEMLKIPATSDTFPEPVEFLGVSNVTESSVGPEVYLHSNLTGSQYTVQPGDIMSLVLNSTTEADVNLFPNLAQYTVEPGEVMKLTNTSQLLNSSIEANMSLTGSNYTGEQVVCSAQVSPASLRNTIIVGFVCMCIYSLAGFVVKFVNTKHLMAGCLLVSSIAGFCAYLARTEWLIVTLCAIFISMSGTCVSMLHSIVIDSIPTQLRAMAVCLSLMSGRFGVAICSLAIGVLLESSCVAVYFMLGGIVLLCCLLSFFIPKLPES